MKFLFVVQGEGRGHLTQAISLSEILERNGHEVISVLVGKSNRRDIPTFFTRRFGKRVRRFDSPNFLPAQKNHKTNIYASIIYNVFRSWKYARSIWIIRRKIAKTRPDVVVNFYELLTGLSYSIFPPQAPCYCVAHQYLLLHPEYRFPRANGIELTMLKFFTRMTCIRANRLLALSIRQMEAYPRKRMSIVPPLLRKEVFETEVSNGNYLHGYLLNANYADEIIDFHARRPDVPLHFFWDQRDAEEDTVVDDNLTFHRINDHKFIRYMAGSLAYATTAGFESVCEAMYMGKPVLVVPTHIEQECNAHEVAEAGAGVVSDSFDLEKLFEFLPCYQPNTEFRDWVERAEERFSILFN